MRVLHWDSVKAESNWIKHGVTFDEAASAFFDENALVANDERHSDFEQRMILTAKSEAGRILTVVFTYRSSTNHEKEICRVISARLASKNEKISYTETASARRQ